MRTMREDSGMAVLLAVAAIMALSTAVHAFPERIPTQTAAVDYNELYGISPMVTHGPLVARHAKRDLNACGYFGTEGITYGCQDPDFCAYLQPANVVGCCQGNSCLGIYSCVNSADINNCDSDCMSNSWIQKCTVASSPICLTMSFPGYGNPVPTAFLCGTSTAPVTVSSVTPVDLFTISLSIPGFSTTSSSTTSSLTDESTLSTIVTDTASTAAAITGTTDTFATSTMSPFYESSGIPTYQNSGPSISGGGIAGAALGGSAAIALFVTLVFCLLRSRSKKRASSSAVGGADYTNLNQDSEGSNLNASGLNQSGRNGMPQISEFQGASHQPIDSPKYDNLYQQNPYHEADSLPVQAIPEMENTQMTRANRSQIYELRG